MGGVRSRQCQGFRRNLSVPVLERALSSSAEGWELGAGGVFSAVGRCLTEPPPLRKGRLQGQGDGACLRRRTLVGGRLDLPDSSSSVPLILRWVALILPRPQALREPRGRVGGRRVWDGAGSGRVGWGRSSIIQIYTPASFANRTQRGSSREKARNPAESLALARLHPMGVAVHTLEPLKTRGFASDDNSKTGVLRLSGVLEPLVFPCPDL